MPFVALWLMASPVNETGFRQGQRHLDRVPSRPVPFATAPTLAHVFVPLGPQSAERSNGDRHVSSHRRKGRMDHIVSAPCLHDMLVPSMSRPVAPGLCASSRSRQKLWAHRSIGHRSASHVSFFLFGSSAKGCLITMSASEAICHKPATEQANMLTPTTDDSTTGHTRLRRSTPIDALRGGI